MLKKYKSNGEIEFRPVYFNSTRKAVINHKFSLENTFQEIFTRLITRLIKDLVGLLN